MGKNLENIGRTFNSITPIVTKAIKSGQLFSPSCKLVKPKDDIICEYDINIPISEGFNVTANVFRSKKANENGEKVPVIMCAHPYDNHITPELKKTPFGGAPQQYRLIPQNGMPEFSTITSWESPDPNFWVESGYAVVNMNLPGYANSGGKPSIFSKHQGKVYYEAIEWIAKQQWCNGNIGLSGVSYLAISQYYVAFCEEYGGAPKSLKAICPWEGLSDIYSDLFCCGGVYEIGFPAFWWFTEVKPTLNGSVQDFIDSEGGIPTELSDNHIFYDDYWKAKVPNLSKITIPMLVCGSFSDHGLHTTGSFRAFEKVNSQYKWLYTHRDGKWDSYYSTEVKNLTRDFFDCFLKEDSNKDFLKTPPVRIEVRSKIDEIHEIRYEQTWPLSNTNYTKLYLSPNNELKKDISNNRSERIFSGKDGKIIFEYQFEENTELTGYMKCLLWVEVRKYKDSPKIPDDMTIFVAVNKLNKDKEPIHFLGSVGNKKDMVTRGMIKVSRREINVLESEPWKPVLTLTSSQKLKENQIVPVDIALYPSSTYFEKGEFLQLIISSKEIIKSPPYRKLVKDNFGVNVIHLGDKYDSHLLIPVII